MRHRDFEEISDDEWENHSFKPSRIIKKLRSSPPPRPTIESFAYRPASTSSASATINLDDDEDYEPEAEPEEEDEDFDEVQVAESSRPSRGRRFVIDDEESDGGAFGGEDDDEEDDWYGLEEVGKEEEEEEVDVVGKALQKCAKISAELRRELYGSTAPACDRYAEVEASCARIVTQEDVDEACAGEDSEFEPTLKPYQLVGVNFLLLLYRKNIGGGAYKKEKYT